LGSWAAGIGGCAARQTLDNQELYKNIFEKAAALMESLVNKHPFIHGNKRTEIACAVGLL
jgi:prophage maintenance system killer protein